MPQFFNSKRLIFTLAAGVVVMGLTACESRLDTRGNMLDPDRVVEIKPGEQSRDEVAAILGSPSSITAFGSDTWYYIAQRTETFAFFAPKVTDRQILVVEFDKEGKVAKVGTVGLEAGKVIDPINRITLTHGNKMTIIEQLVGNLGRFKKDTQKKSQPTTEEEK
ncbi:MAG: outer membrane protein assembly factor BamE [Proteobacteria bacterium]|nr:outer membrane protein assembly factor BamE [Pseudomonadota bacterium]